jgi:hypothetical protein
MIINNPKDNILPPPMYPCIYITAPTVDTKAERDAKKGQGLGSTK